MRQVDAAPVKPTSLPNDGTGPAVGTLYPIHKADCDR